jgi:anti-sigma B factor antagonist
MEIKVIFKKPLEEIPRIQLEGEVDIYTVPVLKDTVINLIDHGHCSFIIDLEKVTHIDSTGLGSLVGIYRRAKERKGKVIIICPNLQIRKVFINTGLDQLFVFYKNDKEFKEKAEGDVNTSPS